MQAGRGAGPMKSAIYLSQQSAILDSSVSRQSVTTTGRLLALLCIILPSYGLSNTTLLIV